LFSVFIRLGIVALRADAGHLPLYSWTRDGRRMEYRGNAGRGDVADGASREGHLDRAELVGDWLRAGGAGDRNRAALCELANGILRRDSTRAGHGLDSARRAGIRNVGTKAGRERFENSRNWSVFKCTRRDSK